MTTVPVKRFSTPIFLEALSLATRQEVARRGFVKVEVREDGYEVRVHTSDDVAVISADHVYACATDQNGFQLSIFLTRGRGVQMWSWNDEGALVSISWRDHPDNSTEDDEPEPSDEELEAEEGTTIILEEDEMDMLQQQQQLARVFGSRSFVGEG